MWLFRSLGLSSLLFLKGDLCDLIASDDDSNNDDDDDEDDRVFSRFFSWTLGGIDPVDTVDPV